MKKLIPLILAFSLIFAGCAAAPKSTAAPSPALSPEVTATNAPSPTPLSYENYSGEIPHIFIHCLIAYPEIKGANGLMPYDSECIDVAEFKNLLRELYANNYCLIDLHDCFSFDEAGKITMVNTVSVPKGKKPFVLSCDDVVYDVKKRGYGMADFLALDENKNFVTGTYQSDGSLSYSNDSEFIPILESFIAEHPDFSANGSRMTLCMTGFTGLFGYRSDRHNTLDRDAQIQKAREIADRLKELGYTFASHSYGHSSFPDMSIEALREDLQSFRDEVEPIIGKVNVLVYPFGLLIPPADPKYQLMEDYGFNVFCSVAHFFLTRDYETNNTIYMTRVAIDGYSLRNYGSILAPLFDVNKVIDLENR
ncbi:MAG: hypothetical protein RSC51_03670 [Oscillospiraceae bacterium]